MVKRIVYILFIICSFTFLNGCSIKKDKEEVEWNVTFQSNRYYTPGPNASDLVVKVKDNGLLEKPDDPIKEIKDYEFVGWYIGDDKWNFDKDIVTRDLTLMAKYETKKYKLIINYNADNVENVVTEYNYGEAIHDVLNYSCIKEGYEFLGFRGEIPTTMPKNDVVIEAIYEYLMRKITFKFFNGVEEDFIIEQPKGTPIEITEEINEVLNYNKKIYGYDLIGWDKELPKYMPEEDMVINLKYLCHIIYNKKNNKINIYGANVENVELCSEYDGIALTEIISRAFYLSKIKSIVIPDTIKIIESEAFAKSYYLSTINFPKDVQIGESAFDSCYALEEINISGNIEIINKAFASCTNLKSIHASSGNISIAEYAFNSCNNLEILDICDGSVKIDVCAFENCSRLSSITLPSSCELRSHAFSYCLNIDKIVYGGSKAEFAKIVINGITSSFPEKLTPYIANCIDGIYEFKGSDAWY